MGQTEEYTLCTGIQMATPACGLIYGDFCQLD